jgi:hypothetical protein
MARVLGALATEKTLGEVRAAAAALARRFPLYED